MGPAVAPDWAHTLWQSFPVHSVSPLWLAVSLVSPCLFLISSPKSHGHTSYLYLHCCPHWKPRTQKPHGWWPSHTAKQLAWDLSLLYPSQARRVKGWAGALTLALPQHLQLAPGP